LPFFITELQRAVTQAMSYTEKQREESVRCLCALSWEQARFFPVLTVYFRSDKYMTRSKQHIIYVTKDISKRPKEVCATDQLYMYLSKFSSVWLTSSLAERIGPPSLHLHPFRGRFWKATSFSTVTAWKPFWHSSVLIMVWVFHRSLVTGFSLWEVDHSNQ